MTDKELVKKIVERRPVACDACGGKLKYIGGGQYECVHCKETCFDDFGKVRQFLYENGPSPAPVVVAATGVNSNIVIELLKQGRIELVNDSRFFLSCERCGCAIRYGRICPDCAKKDADKISEELRESIGEKPMKVVTIKKDKDHKMRYYSVDKDDIRK